MGEVSYSRNYGTFATSTIGSSLGSYFNIPRADNIFKAVNQFSAYLEVGRKLKNGVSINWALAADRGKRLDNSTSGILKVVTTF